MKCCDITAGMMRHNAAIQQYTDVADGGGGSARTWSNVIASQLGFLKPISGNERLHADQLEAVVTHKFLTRYTATIVPKMRLVYGGRNFNIRAVINIEERNRFLELHLQEGVAT